MLLNMCAGLLWLVLDDKRQLATEGASFIAFRSERECGLLSGIYLALMDDRYPSTEEQQAVHLDFDYPDASHDLNRWLPLVQ